MPETLPTVGGDDGTWGTELNNYLRVIHAADGYINDGTEALPGLAFSDGTTPDTDTGFRHPGANRIGIVTAGADRWEIGATGHLLAVDDNTYDIGASGGSTRPRHLYLAGNISTAANPAGTGFFTLIDLEPTTSSAGIIRWNGTDVMHTYGTSSTFVGAAAGNYTFTGSGENSGFGANALTSLTTAQSNNAFGLNALRSVTSGSFNASFGTDNSYYVTTGARNVAMGHNAAYALSTGNDNIWIGVNNGLGSGAGPGITASQNVRIGSMGAVGSTGITTGNNNVTVGYNAGLSITSGNDNVGVGSGAIDAITTAIQNVGVGTNALSAVTTGSQNTGVGDSVLAALTTSAGNVGVGESALAAVTTGARNVAVGTQAGFHSAGTSEPTTASDNTFIGDNTRFGSATQHTFATAIGAQAIVDASNTMVLGGTGSATVVVVVGATSADSNVGQGGLYLNQLGIDTQILALASTDVTHALTTGGFTAMGTNSYFAVLKQSATEGGAHLAVVAEDGGSSNRVLQISAAGGTPDTTDTSGSYGLVHVTVAEHDAANAFANSGATANIFTVAGRTAGAEATRFLVKANGDVHVTNTTLVALDDVPDALVMRAGRAAMAPKGSQLRKGATHLIRKYKRVLEDNRIMFFEPDGQGAMQNVVPSIMLAWDGLYQAHKERAQLKRRIERLEASLLN